MISKIFILFSLFVFISFDLISDTYGPLAKDSKHGETKNSIFAVEVGQNYGTLNYIRRNDEDRTLFFLTGNPIFNYNNIYKSIINNSVSFQIPSLNLSYWLSEKFSLDIGINNFSLPGIEGNLSTPIIGGKYFFSNSGSDIFLLLNLGQFSNNSFGNSGKIHMAKIGIGYRYEFNDSYYLDGILSYYNFRPNSDGFQYQFFQAEGPGIDFKVGYKFELSKK